MNWNCEQIEASLSDYLEGALTPEEAAQFVAHSSTCAQCKELVASVRGLIGAMHALEPVAAPVNLMPAILNSTIGPRPSSGGWRAWFGWTRVILQPRFAYGALTVLITLGVVSQALGIQWRMPTVADLNPVNLYRSADRTAHLAYAKGSKFVGDLRVVYEIRSRLEPSEQDETPQKAPAAAPSSPGQSKTPITSPLNRAESVENYLTRLASGVWIVPVRSMP
jgi:anti-sigma factor RsiW|nr:zf-HC2 domain-containing protein [Candidatus Acidoferrales bacterium]